MLEGLIRKYKLSKISDDIILSKKEIGIIKYLENVFCGLKITNHHSDDDRMDIYLKSVFGTVLYYSNEKNCVFSYYKLTSEIDINGDIVENLHLIKYPEQDIYNLIIEWIIYVYNIEVVKIGSRFYNH